MTQQDAIPRFRGKPHRLKSGEVITYYFWDGRTKGLGTVALGKDREKAEQLWRLCEQGVMPLRPVKTRAKPLPKPKPGQRRMFSLVNWRGAPAWARRLYLGAQSRASANGKTFTITPDEFAAVIERAQGRCEVSAIPLDVSGVKRSPFSPSLDRIESSKGYENGNVRVVCHLANVAMNTWGVEPLAVFAEALLRQRQNILCAKSEPMLQKA